ncbi:hypothetical protein ABKP74_03310 [Bifidobacterium breve]|uniref:hypothetical protein n=1 Tax=Bifidobacterium breve TaxID=1685 RepID=UPI0032E012FA
MATKIRTLGEGKLNITDTTNARDFSGDVTKAQLVASNSSEDPVNFLDGSQETSTTTTWTLEGTIGDDFGSDSLSLWCFDHAGETLPFEFVPNIKGGIKWTGNAEISPVSVGGDVKSKNTNDFSFPVTNLQHAPYTNSVSE